MVNCVVSMFDESGNALRPWAEAGYICYAFDILNEFRIEHVGCGVIIYEYADFHDPVYISKIVSLHPVFLMGFPPCDDLAVSGTKHWVKKALIDPLFQDKAVSLVMTVPFVGMLIGSPWFFENPVGALSSKYRKPDFYFDPCDFGGYLPIDDVHPRWPDHITPRDAYTKKTGIWFGNGFIEPGRLPVEPLILENDNGVRGSQQFMKLGGKSKKTKQIRSEGPRGFLKAVFLANHQHLVATSIQ